MLILKRKQGERIRINDDLVIIVGRIDRNAVLIGIEAPRGVNIQREEIYLAKQIADKHTPVEGTTHAISHN